MWVAGWLRRTEEPQETTNAESGTGDHRRKHGGRAQPGRGAQRSARVAWRVCVAAENGERVLVIKGGTLGEERYVAGSLDAAREQDDLDDGEVRIYAESGGASITLRRNGHVEIEGDLFINGAMYVPPVKLRG